MSDSRNEPARPGARLAIVAVAGVLVLGLAAAAVTALMRTGRDEPVAVTPPETPVSESAEAPASPDLSIEGQAETVAFLIMTSSSGWAAHITGTETTTLLRRPVIIVATDIGPEQAGLSDEFTTGLSSFAAGLTTADGAPYTYHLQIRSSEGDVIGVISSTDDRWELEVPTAPGDTESLRSWLDAVYGSGAPRPETWFVRITGIDGSVDADGNVVVRTDLDPDSLDDQQTAQTIIDAVNSSGATFAQGIRVVFGDGTFEWSALLDGVDPFGP